MGINMIQISKKQYYILVILLFLAVLYGNMKYIEARNQQDYLNPYLMDLMHTMQNETHITSIILTRAITDKEISYVQWLQLKDGFETIRYNSYEIEKMGRAIYPNYADGLVNATTVTAYLFVSNLEYIEDNFFQSELDRFDKISFPEDTLAILEPIHETSLAWREITNKYYLTNKVVKHKYWVDMMKELQTPSISYQHKY